MPRQYHQGRLHNHPSLTAEGVAPPTKTSRTPADQTTTACATMKGMPTPEQNTVLELNESLLEAIGSSDWERYAALCAEDLTCFEPEARGQQVSGLAFHKFYFENGGHLGAHNSTLSSPKVRMLGTKAAVVSYVRLVQRLENGGPTTQAWEETRVWQNTDGVWKCVHFHRSASGK